MTTCAPDVQWSWTLISDHPDECLLVPERLNTYTYLGDLVSGEQMYFSHGFEVVSAGCDMLPVSCKVISTRCTWKQARLPWQLVQAAAAARKNIILGSWPVGTAHLQAGATTFGIVRRPHRGQSMIVHHWNSTNRATTSSQPKSAVCPALPSRSLIPMETQHDPLRPTLLDPTGDAHTALAVSVVVACIHLDQARGIHAAAAAGGD